jgi:hypothetical protein
MAQLTIDPTVYQFQDQFMHGWNLANEVDPGEYEIDTNKTLHVLEHGGRWGL